MEKYLENAKTFLFEYGPNVLYALGLLIVGLFLIKKLVKFTKKIMSSRKVDITLQNFLINIVSVGLKLLLPVAVISKLGIDTTAIAATLAAAGLGVGLALQGALSNLAGGVLIIVFKPFKIGDLVDAHDELGIVKDINIFTTQILTPDNKRVIIPNGTLANSNIINYSAEEKLGVDLTIGVGYDEDIKQTKKVLLDVLKHHNKVLEEPQPSVNVEALADSSVNFAVRPWCKVEHYWDVYFGITENCKIALDKAGIEIPYPHSVEIQKRA
ncbi:MAG: mechanosensitive ion channel [Bacteroidetes bacterium]|nr:mechanosensitive ion channel [Bacteroidota bacterium]MDA0860715.1 mechanosensitive ion channel [Bacteroidota bacterium]MDA1319246.1 mechanosensitive ion channel [Bacteroidota bacterium]